MTISIDPYFSAGPPGRKKEPALLAVINKDSCTSCNACATVCPVDCIYEIVDPTPSQSYHVIDTERCIGCQLCYRIPSESTERYTLELCPWNAIDLLDNPAVAEHDFVLRRYWLGAHEELDWATLDEFGFQLAANGEVYLAAGAKTISVLNRLTEPKWGHGDDVRALTDPPTEQAGRERFSVTQEGHELLKVAFREYENVFLD